MTLEEIKYAPWKNTFMVCKDHKQIREATHKEIYEEWSYNEDKSRNKMKKYLKTELTKLIQNW